MYLGYLVLRLVDFLIGLIESLLALRLVLRFFNANPNTPFVDWLYKTTEPLIYPFKGIFPHPILEGGFLLEFSTIFAMIIYGLVGYLITEVLAFLAYSSSRY